MKSRALILLQIPSRQTRPSPHSLGGSDAPNNTTAGQVSPSAKSKNNSFKFELILTLFYLE